MVIFRRLLSAWLSMKRYIDRPLIALYFFVVTLSSHALAQEVITSSTTSDESGCYNCSCEVKLYTSTVEINLFATTISTEVMRLRLSQTEGVWSLGFWVPNKPAIFGQKHFFYWNGYRNEEAFNEAFGSIRLANYEARFNNVDLRPRTLEMISEDTRGEFEILERRNVTEALFALQQDGIEIPGLINLKGTSSYLEEFRDCSYSAMGIGENQQEIVTHAEHYGECAVNLFADERQALNLSLNRYQGIWRLDFTVRNRPLTFSQQELFDDDGYIDRTAFEETFGSVSLGNHEIDFNDTYFWGLIRSNIDEDSRAVFKILEKHNVADALFALQQDVIVIPGLIHLEGTSALLEEFRTCSYAKMGLQKNQRVETDYRAEFRMMFEETFENWIENRGKAVACLATSANDSEVDEVIEAAANAFYPGWLNFRKRRAYRESFEQVRSTAYLRGLYKRGGCMLAGRILDLSRMTLDSAINAAERID